MPDYIKKAASADGTYQIDERAEITDHPAGAWLEIGPTEKAVVSGVNQRYWKPSGSTLAEMTDAEKVAVELPGRLTAVDAKTETLAISDITATYLAANSAAESTLKTALNAATTLTALDAVKDTRA